LNIINKDPENPSVHEMQLTIEKMKKEFEESRKQLPRNTLLEDISEISRKQFSKKADEPESMYEIMRINTSQYKVMVILYFMNRHEI
jgi:hypothetical protein